MPARRRTLACVSIVLGACLLHASQAPRALAFSRDGKSEVSTGANDREGSCRSVDSALAHASALMEAQQYGDAARLLQPLATSHCDPRIALLLSAALEGSGDMPDARIALQTAQQVWPQNNSIATSLARQYVLGHQHDQAAAALRNFHPDANTAPQELALGVEVYMATHALPKAQWLAEFSYRTYPSEESTVLLANVLQLEGRSQAVVSLMNGMRTKYGNGAAFLTTVAESEYDLGMYQPAYSDLSRAVTLRPDAYQVHYLLGNTLLKQGKSDQAIAEYQAAIRLAPNEPRSYYQLALALVERNDRQGAKRALTQALQANSQYAAAYYEMGMLLFQENRLPEAVDQLKSAVRYNPDFEAAYFMLVRAYARLGQDQERKAALARYLAMRNANRTKPPVQADAAVAPGLP